MSLAVATPADFPQHEWLEAIDQPPRMSTANLLFAYDALGVETGGLTKEQIKDSWLKLIVHGFLRCVDHTEGGVFVYEPRLD